MDLESLLLKPFVPPYRTQPSLAKFIINISHISKRRKNGYTSELLGSFSILNINFTSAQNFLFKGFEKSDRTGSKSLLKESIKIPHPQTISFDYK